jgi:hypothetical protein
MLRLSRPWRRLRAINGLTGRRFQVAFHSVSLRHFVPSPTVEFPPYRLLVPPTPLREEDLEAVGLTKAFARRCRSSKGHLPCARRSDRPKQPRVSLRASVVYDRRAQVHSSMTVRVGRSLRDRRHFERRQQDDLRHKKIALVTTANYPGWARWAMLKRVSVW